MSSRAKRINNPASVLAFPWNRTGRAPAAPSGETVGDGAVLQSQVAAAERDAFARGFAQGEAAAAAATHDRSGTILRQLTQALQDVTALRIDMIRRTERQMVQLALSLARRIVHREISLDHEVLLAMARGALDRLGEGTRVTVRLHPEDYDAIAGARIAQMGSHVTVVADGQVAPGGCRIESDLGTLDAGVDAQIQEFGRALLGEEVQPQALGHVA